MARNHAGKGQQWGYLRTPIRKPLKELLAQIQSKEAALPDFQRDFVWDPNATQELIVSIASNYPAGSLLRIRNTHALFACREVHGAPALEGQSPTFLVLDGQQRLTSLFQAFYGVGDHRYYLRVDELLKGRDFEDCIFHLRAKPPVASTYGTLANQAQDLTLPLSVLKDGAGGFSTWMLAVAQQAANATEGFTLLTKLNTIQERWIKPIDGYQFPVVTLSDEASAEAVCTIFETLNRTGVKLSVFELLTARFWHQQVNLRDLWTKARQQHTIITDFGVDPYYLLQAVSLLSRPAPTCKRSDVLALPPAAVTEYWESAVKGLARALQLLRDDCGGVVPEWLPYYTIIIPLSAVLAKFGIPIGPTAGAQKHKLMQWFWCSVFGQTYENAPNSQAAKDMVELTNWLNGGAEPESVSGFQFLPALLRETTPRQRALYRGVMCLVLTRGPRDFHNLDLLTGPIIAERRVDDHHVFPQAFLNGQKAEPRLRDCVLNRTLIDAATNRHISSRAPTEYLGEMREELGESKFQQLLYSHLLPGGPDSPFWNGDFNAFLTWRQDALWHEIQRVTGAANAPSALLHEEMTA